MPVLEFLTQKGRCTETLREKLAEGLQIYVNDCIDSDESLESAFEETLLDFIELANAIEFDVDFYKLNSIKEAFAKKSHKGLALRIRVLCGLASRAGCLTKNSTK